MNPVSYPSVDSRSSGVKASDSSSIDCRARSSVLLQGLFSIVNRVFESAATAHNTASLLPWSACLEGPHSFLNDRL